MKKRAARKAFARIAALTLVVAVAAVLVPDLAVTHASAYSSLEHIESIKQSQTVFTVLEIVPLKGSGSVGYYADGQEPTSSWKSEAAKIVNTAAAPAGRKNYVDALAASLKARGLLGDSAASGCPLTQVGAYAEYLPWASIPDGVSTETLKLTDGSGNSRNESVTVHGDFEYKGAGQGVFSLNSTPNISAESGGDYVQNIQYFVKGAPASGDSATYYYYNPVFAKVDQNNAASYALNALYKKSDDGTYVYDGTLGVDGYSMEVGQEYWYVVKTVAGPLNTGAPADALSDSRPYRATASVSSPYTKVAAGTGWFTMTEVNYVYAGANKGDYTFTAADGGTAHEVQYNAVYISGGYTNNNWFLKDVFNVPEGSLASSSLKVKVYSVSPEDAGSNLENLINVADMIVVSAGLDLSTGSGLASKYAADTNDLTADQVAKIEAAKTGGTAVLLDSRVSAAADGTNIKTLASWLLGGAAAPFVNGSLYCFAPDNNLTDSTADDDRTALATKNFSLNFPDSLSAGDNAPYSAVRAEIEYENFLRTNANPNISANELLPTGITIANCIRYIINYSGQRVQNKKTSIKVLDIEPLTRSTALTAATVASWLPSDSGISTASISITTMSTAEFISKIEDINEVYDLVYVGASDSSLAGFNTTTDSSGALITSYNDSDMNGLIYSNIGDTYASSNLLAGLLDSDYSGDSADVFTLSSFYNGISTADVSARELSSGTKSYRFSGNDITKVKGRELSDFVSSGFPVVIADALIDPGHAATPDRTLSVSAAGSVSESTTTVWVPRGHSGKGSWETVTTYTVTLTATPSFADAAMRYQWYRDGTAIGTFSASGSYSFSTTSDPGGVYSCEVTYQGLTATSNQVLLSKYRIPVTCQAGSEAYTYTAIAPSSLGTVSYKWYVLSYNDYYGEYDWYSVSSGGTGASYTGSNGKTYLCMVTSGGNSYFSPAVTYNYNGFSITAQNRNYRRYDSGWHDDVVTSTSSWSTVTVGAGVSGTIPGQSATAYSINPDTVDNSSILFSTLSGVLSSKNVMSAANAAKQQGTLLKYLNLSKPSVTFSSKPAEYNNDYSKSLVQNQTLTYTFTITNPTDPAPLTTRYTCSLYIDLNADGRYKDDEQLADLLIKDGNGRIVESNALAAGTAYTVTRQLPAKYSGLIPWRLKIAKNGASNIHTSQTGYTYIKPSQATELNILQITSFSGSNTSRRFSLADNSTYKTLFGDLRDAQVYDIKVTPISVSTLNSMSASAIAAEFSKYNMLIIGFGDGYGFKETGAGLDLDAAQAIVNYVNSGKAVLFTHDTTSFANLPVSDYKTTSGATNVYSGFWYWGYYFNDVVRDAVGLDRYGVTSPAFGINAYSPLKSYLQSAYANSNSATYKTYGTTYSGLVPSGYNSSSFSTAAEKAAAAGYTMAYEPKSGKSAGVSEVQGYTATTLLRFYANTTQKTSAKGLTVPSQYGQNTTTSEVSLVNKGQITTFPYNLNSTALSVSETHDQYYQLNMNSDDIVVWYCLSAGTDGKYTNYFKNDGTNAYYIYNRGNVTYSGAGHDPYNVTWDEAKLFVNTMIAAYRAGAEDPTIGFKSADNQSITSQFLPFEYSGNAETSAAGTALEDAQSVYFSFSDPNLTAGKSIGVTFYYGDETGGTADSELKGSSETAPKVTSFTADVYRADTNEKVTSLRSDLLYYISLPQALLAKFAASSDASMTIYAKVTTTIGTSKYVGSTSLTLRKLGLLILR